MAALGMILAYYGKAVEMENVRHATGVSRDCMSAADMVRAARHYGLVAKAFTRHDPADLRTLPVPFVAHLGFIHFVVVEGITDTHLLVNDPAVGRRKIALEDVGESFTGIVISFEPGPDFYREARPEIPMRAYLQRVGRSTSGAWILLALAAICGLMLGLPLIGFIATAARLPAGNVQIAGELALLAIATLSYGTVSAIMGSALNRLRTTMASSQAEDIARRLRAVPFSFFAYRLPWRLRTTIYSQAEVARVLCEDLLPALLRLPVVALLLIAAWWLVEPSIGIVLSLLSGMALLAWPLLFRWRSGYMRQRSEAPESNIAAVANTLEEIENLKLANMADEYLVSSAGARALRQLNRQRAGLACCAIDTLAQGLHLVLPLALLAAGALVGRTAPLGPGEWLAGFLIAVTLAAELQRWATLPGKLDHAQHQLLHIDDVYRQPPQAEPATSIQTDPDLPSGALEMRGVVFGYAIVKPSLLTGVDLRLAPGEQLGITGPSGSGKSTLGGLLCGLHRPQGGQIKVGAGDTATTPLVAWVDKSAFFFEGSVRDNLCLGRMDVAPQDIDRALRDACIDELLADRPGGLDAHIEARGRNFSGGQLQRLEIARALIGNPAILILDEATDALQPALEAAIRAKLRRRGCSLIIISHRASTFEACDRVIRMQSGRIVDASSALAMPAAETQPTQHMTVDAYATEIEGGEDEWLDAEPIDETRRQALIAAFAAVARAVGQPCTHELRMAAPPDRIGSLLIALARQEGMLVRRVRLAEARLWRMDHGPLIAFLRSNNHHPVALLPRGYRYRMAGAPPSTVTEIDSSTLCREAYCLYPGANDAPASPRHMLRRALGSASVDLWRALGTSVATWAIAALPPLFVFWMLSAPGAMSQALPPLLMGMAAFVIASGLIEFARQLALLRIESTVESRLLLRLQQHLVRLRPGFVRRFSPEQLWNSVAGFNRLLQRTQVKPLSRLLNGGFMLTTTFLLALIAPAQLPLALLLVLPALLASPMVTGLSRQTRQRQSAADTIARRLLIDILRGIARLRQLDADGALLARWQEQDANERRLSQRLRAWDRLDEWWADSYPWLALVPWLGGLIAAGASPAVMLTTTLALIVGIRGAHDLGMAWAELRRSDLFIAESRTLTEEAAEPGAAPGRPSVSAAEPIVMDGICFHYSGTHAPALADVSLRIEPGQFIVIAGPSGGGKSTLLRLLLGFEVPDAGEVRIGPQRLADLDLAAWRRGVGAVRQDERLESASTLRSQISGLSPYGLDEVWKVAQQVVLAEDIRGMPMGMQTIVEGNKISTGQEQRLLIARQLIRRPSLLILDEATNAIPEQVQAELFANLRARGITCIVVSHRESTLALADRIFFIDAGRLVWNGPPAALVNEQRLLALMRAERAVEEIITP